MERKTRAATESGILLLVVAGILVAANAVSAFGMYGRYDTTLNQRFKISEGSGHLVRSLGDKLTVDLYVTKGLPKLDAFVRDLRDLMNEYKAKSAGKFEFTIIEAKDDDQKKAAKDAGLMEAQMGEGSETEGDKASIAQGFMGMVLKYKSEKDVIEFLSPDHSDGLEFWITNKIRGLRDKADNIKHKVGVVTGHDEIKLTETSLVPSRGPQKGPNIQDILTKNFPFYSFQEVDLKGGDGDIDESLDGLIITQPGKDFTDKELRRIDQFVMKGKSLALFASAVNVKASDATMNATISTHGLEKLMDGYGIEMKKDAVLDFGRSFMAAIPTQTGAVRIKFPQFLDVVDDFRYSSPDERLLDTSFPAFFRMQEAIFPFASSIVVHAEKQPEAKFNVTARSTPHSIVLTGDTVSLKPFQQWKPKGQWAQFALGAAVEADHLKSAFAGADKMGIESPDKSAKNARVMIISASQFLTNPFARAGNGPDLGPQFGGMNMGDEMLQAIGNAYANPPAGSAPLMTAIVALKNTCDWLSGDTDLLASSAKILGEPSLVYGDTSKPNYNEETDEQLKKRDQELKAARKTQQAWITWILILGIPIAFSLLGVARWRLRMNARENVSLA